MADRLGTMTPDSSEGRERITRLESRLEDVRSDVERNERTFGPLPLAVERLQWTIDAINARLDKHDREDEERFEKLTRSFENQLINCRTAVNDVATEQKRQSEVFLAWQEKERQRREAERKEAEELRRQEEKDAQTSKTEKFIAKYGLVGVLGAAVITAAATILNTVLS